MRRALGIANTFDDKTLVERDGIKDAYRALKEAKATADAQLAVAAEAAAEAARQAVAAEAARQAAAAEAARQAAAAETARLAAIAAAAAEAERQRLAEIATYVGGHNVTQVYNEYVTEMRAKGATSGPKFAGGVNPVTYVDEDGVTNYSRAYRFADLPVGEVHIHWQYISRAKTVASKVHFKKEDKLYDRGAQYQHNLATHEAKALGIKLSAPDNEKWS
jgi:hypothetical protein